MFTTQGNKIYEELELASSNAEKEQFLDDYLCIAIDELYDRHHQKIKSNKKSLTDFQNNFKKTILSLAHQDPALMLAVLKTSGLAESKFKLTKSDKEQILYDAVINETSDIVAICISEGINPLSCPRDLDHENIHLINNLDKWSHVHPRQSHLTLSWCAAYCSDEIFDIFMAQAEIKPDINGGELLYRSLEGRNYDRYISLCSRVTEPKQYDREIISCAISKGRTYILETLSLRQDPVSLEDLRHAWKLAIETRDIQSLFYLKKFGYKPEELANYAGTTAPSKENFINAVRAGEDAIASLYLQNKDFKIDSDCILEILKADCHKIFLDALSSYFENLEIVDGKFNLHELYHNPSLCLPSIPDNLQKGEWNDFLREHCASSKLALGIIIKQAARNKALGCVKKLCEIGAPLWNPGEDWETGEVYLFSQDISINNFLSLLRSRSCEDEISQKTPPSLYSTTKSSGNSELHPRVKKLFNLDKTSTRLESLTMHVDILIGNLLSKYIIPWECFHALAQELIVNSIKYIENPENHTDFKKSLLLIEDHFSGMNDISDMVEEVGMTIFLPRLIKPGATIISDSTKKLASQLAAVAILQGRSIEEIYILSARWHKTANKLPLECRPAIIESEWKRLFNQEVSLDDKWSVVSLGTQKELSIDGDALHHCIGRGTYASACMDGNVHILSFRKNGVPFATAHLEVAQGSIDDKCMTLPNGERLKLVQFHVAANGPVTDEENNMWEQLLILAKTGKLKLNNGPYGSTKERGSQGDFESLTGFPIQQAEKYQNEILDWYAARVVTKSKNGAPLITPEQIEYAFAYRDSIRDSAGIKISPFVKE